MQNIAIGTRDISLQDFQLLLYQSANIVLPQEVLARVDESFRFLQEFAKGRVVYGVNTGFGPMAPYLIKPEQSQELQYNLIRSHSAGTGQILPMDGLKAVLIARLSSLIQGYSGIHTDAVVLLQSLINQNILPVIYEHGGVGASGDLVQVAHLALMMIGEGEAIYENSIQSTKSVFQKTGISPLKMYLREGLALINGTSAMTGIGVINVLKSSALLEWMVLASAMITEIVEAYDDHFSAELNRAKKHRGQQVIAQKMRDILTGSQRTRKRYNQVQEIQLNGVRKLKEKVQEYYSLRCISQVLGPVFDTIQNAGEVVTNELNSANDNPIVDVANRNVLHGGNFHGDYISLEMDKLKIAMTKLSMLCERQLNYLLNDKLNGILPPFVNTGVLGLNFGMQGAQFTAVSTVAENQTLSNPMYIHSIPNNNDNQDIVSMGTNAAMLAHKVIDNSFEVLAIHFMTILQAIDYLKISDQLAPKTRAVYDEMRGIFPVFSKDTPLYGDIHKMKSFLTRQFIIEEKTPDLQKVKS